MFDSIINGVAEKFGLGDKAGALISALLAMMTDSENGGFAGFLNRFRTAGLGDLADSWVSSGANTPISNEQLESALGADTLRGISEQVGTDYDTTVSGTAYLVPHVVDELTPNGEVPEASDLLSRIGGYLTGLGAVAGGLGAAGVAGGAFDRVDASVSNTTAAGKAAVGSGIDTVDDTAAAVGSRVSGTMSSVGDTLDGDGGSILKWLIPLLLLGLLVVLGFWFCGKSETTAPVGNANVNRTNANTN